METKAIEVSNFIQLSDDYVINIENIVAYSMIDFEVAEITHNESDGSEEVSYFITPYLEGVSLAIFVADKMGLIKPYYLTSFNNNVELSSHIKSIKDMLDFIFLPMRKNNISEGIHGKTRVIDIVSKKEVDVIDEFRFVEIGDILRVRRDSIISFYKDEPVSIANIESISKYLNLFDIETIIDPGSNLIIVPHRKYADADWIRYPISVETTFNSINLDNSISQFILTAPISTKQESGEVFDRLLMFSTGVEKEVNVEEGEIVHKEVVAEEGILEPDKIEKVVEEVNGNDKSEQYTKKEGDKESKGKSDKRIIRSGNRRDKETSNRNKEASSENSQGKSDIKVNLKLVKNRKK